MGNLEHEIFKHVKHYFKKGDCLVLNDTKVLPARLFGVKEETGAKVEVLLLTQQEGDRWETLGQTSQTNQKRNENILWRWIINSGLCGRA